MNTIISIAELKVRNTDHILAQHLCFQFCFQFCDPYNNLHGGKNKSHQPVLPSPRGKGTSASDIVNLRGLGTRYHISMI